MSDPIVPAIVVSAPSHPEVQMALDDCRKSFSEVRVSWCNALERAVAHGKTIAKLRVLAQKHNEDFTKLLDKAGFPRSTAYENEALAEYWDRAQSIMVTAGISVEFGSALDVIRLVDPERFAELIVKKKSTIPTPPPIPGKNYTLKATQENPDLNRDPTEGIQGETVNGQVDQSEKEINIVERFVTRMGDKITRLTVKEGGSVRIGNKSVKVDRPLLIVVEAKDAS